MSLARGRPYLAIPGPSPLPESVLQAMMRPSPNIYAGELVDMTHSIAPDLKKVAGTEGDVAIYISNGHGAWEAALSNILSRGDTVLALATGRFGHGWIDIAKGLHINVQTLDFGVEEPVDHAKVEDALRADTDQKIRAVLMVHVDTSSSIKSDVTAVRKALDAAGHPALLAVDCIASLGCDHYAMDKWGVDVTISASQKGLLCPPGLGFVWFNDRAAAARKTADLASRYWDWQPRANPELFYQYFGGTAPTHHLYALRAALDLILNEGLDSVWHRHETLARAVWAAVDQWGTSGDMRLNVANPKHRGHSVTSIHLGDGNADRLRAWTEENAGITLGIGLGREPMTDWFRIAHMGHVNAHMTLGVLAAIEAGLTALDIPHGAGALDAAARIAAAG